MQINLFIVRFYSFALDHCLLYSIPYYLRGKIKRCSLVSRGVRSSSRGCSLVSRGCRRHISRRTQAGGQGAVISGRRGVVRLNGDCRVSVELGISLIINYLSSPLGRKKQKAISRNTLNTNNFEGI